MLKRRITKIGQEFDCYHCGQLVQYPAPYFEGSPGVGTDPEKFCSEKCHSLSCTLKEGRVTAPAGPNTPRRAADPSVRTNIARAKADRAAKQRILEERRRRVIANAIRQPRPGR